MIDKFTAGQPLGWVAGSLASGAIAWLTAASPSRAACNFFSIPQRFNTVTAGDVIVLGQLPEQPYRVIVLGGDARSLTSIRQCVLDAFATESRLGAYIQVGSFDNRRDAENIQRILRRAGYRPRLIYAR